MARGFAARLLHELRAEVARPTGPFTALAPLREHFALLPLSKSFGANVLQWAGAALMGGVGLDSSRGVLVTREFFLATRRVPDWTSLHAAAAVF